MGVKVREKEKGSEVWWVFLNHRGQRRAHRVGKLGLANKVADRLRLEIAAGTFKLATKGRTFETVAKQWLEQMPTLRDIRLTTQENYRSFTEHHLIPYFGRYTVGEITPAMIEQFMTAKLMAGGSVRHEGKPLKKSSLSRGMVVLRLILQKAVKSKELDVNPMTALDRLPRGAGENVDPFTTDELRAILRAAQEIDADAATLVRLWAQTGMRAGELAGLQRGDFDLKGGVVTVQRTFTRGRIGPTKTGRIRTVSILHPVTESVAGWRPGSTAESRSVIEGLRRLAVTPIDPTRFLFGRDGDPLDSMMMSRLWRRIIAKAKVRYRSPEQLRHTFASTMLSRNAPLLYVQSQGGWASAAVLLRIYARWMPGQDFAGQAQPPATPAQPEQAEALPMPS